MNRLSIRGVPYGPLAFKDTEALLALAEMGQHVFLIDAELFQALDSAEKAEFDALLRELDGRGMVAFFLEGTMSLQQSYPARPLLWHGPAEEGWYLTIGNLHKDVRDDSSVITADLGLALAAGKRGMRAHLIGAEAPGRASDENPLLRRYASISIFKESLAVQPIGP